MSKQTPNEAEELARFLRENLNKIPPDEIIKHTEKLEFLLNQNNFKHTDLLYFRAVLHNCRAIACLQCNNLNDARLNISALIELGEQAENDARITQIVLNSQGYYYAVMGDHKQSFECFFKLLNFCREHLANSDNHIVALVNVAEAYRDTNQFREALEFLTEGYEIASKNPDKGFYRRHVGLMISNILSNLGENERAVKFVTDEINEAKDEFEVVKMIFLRANVLSRLGKFEESVRDYDKSLEIFKKMGWDQAYYRTLNDKAECFIGMKLFDEALVLALQSLEVRKKQEVPIDIAWSLAGTGLALHKTGKSHEGFSMLAEAKVIASEQQAGHLLELILNSQANITFEIGKFEESASFYKEILQRRNDREKEQLGYQIAFANVKYEVERALTAKRTAEKDREITKKELKLLSQKIIRTNEILRGFIQSLEAIEIVGVGKEQIKKTIRAVDETLTNEQHWEIFQTQFNIVYGEFIKFLSQKHPNLTLHEMKICAFLQSGMTNKEIALLLNNSNRTIENHRNSIRKKIGLNRDNNLIELLNSISILAQNT